MHITAFEIGKLFFTTYCSKGKKIVDVGSVNINGTLKSFKPANCEYIGIDMESGKDVDIVSTDPYVLPFESDSIDVILSTSCFEHCEFFWILFVEIIRVLKPNGLFYLNVPSNGKFHRHPVDCWRFYPDSCFALRNWANKSGYNVEIMESFTGTDKYNAIANENWKDHVSVFIKDKKYSSEYPERIQHKYTDFVNGITIENLTNIVNYVDSC
jgi:SAM-dependent methyltransferase